MKNPCKQCLVKMMCRTMCDEKIKSEDIRERRIIKAVETFDWIINGFLFIACIITIVSIMFK